MKTVLCIDDDGTGLSLRKMMLEEEGYYVFTANSGEEGLALLDAQRIDAVILDYRMPEMNGGEVARRIRDRCSRTFSKCQCACTGPGEIRPRTGVLVD